MNLKLYVIKVYFLLIVILFSQCLFADEVVVHEDEQAAMDSLMKTIGVSDSAMSVGKSEKIDKYSKSINIKNRYYHKNDGRKDLWFVTNQENRISALKISWTNLSDLKQIVKFKNLKFLTITSNKFKNLKGVSNLKELKYLDVSGNDFLTDLGAVRDLPNLVEFDGKTLPSKTIEGMKNLPELKVFICEYCEIENINSLGEFKNLIELNVGTTTKSLGALKNLNKLEKFKVIGSDLTDASAINGMKSIKSIVIYDSKIEELALSHDLINLESFRVVDSKLKTLPDFNFFKKIKKISIVRSEISSVSSIHDLSELQELYLGGNENLNSVNGLKNLPNLKELEFNKSPIKILNIGYLPNLESLDLSGTNITKLEGFSSYPKLRKLFLNNTKVTSLEGAEDAPYLFWVQTDRSVSRNKDNSITLLRLSKRRSKPLMDILNDEK